MDPQFQPWDSHTSIKTELPTICAHTDQPYAALIQDLKGRGLLDSTIVMWTGEFGRLPITQGGGGRDHNHHAFSLLMAGGGFKKGFVYGETDEFGYRSVVNRVSVPDLHATIFHQMGLDHDRLTISSSWHSGEPDRRQGQRRPRRSRPTRVSTSGLMGAGPSSPW